MIAVKCAICVPASAGDFAFKEGLSVILRSGNQPRSVPERLARVFDLLRTCATDFEVIIPQDSAPAGTLTRLQESYGPHLRVVSGDPRATGCKEWVVIPGENATEDLSDLIEVLRSRRSGSSQGWHLFPGSAPPPLSLRTIAMVGVAVTFLSFLAYARTLSIPFISDDYLQIELGRQYGPISGWPDLFRDALYRCRATSLVLTYLTERAFGANPIAFTLSSVGLHILNSMLVLALGFWRPIGWKVSAVAACLFAVSQRHHEAVIWYAAVPELLVFLFGVLSFLCWVKWLQDEGASRGWLPGSFGLFVLALLSKESAVAVVPLMLFAAAIEGKRWSHVLWAIWPFAGCSLAYFGLAYAAKSSHQHFNDGTFSVSAPFIQVILRSAGGLLWFWGWLALVALAIWRAGKWKRLLWVAAAWSIITLLPYSFLTYMPRVPSRHTYFASVGLALVLAAALIEFHRRMARSNRSGLVATVAAALLIHECGYLWFVKHRQFEMRANPTEQLIQMADHGALQIFVKCFPYPQDVAVRALRIRAENPTRTKLVFGADAATHPAAIDLCEDSQR